MKILMAYGGTQEEIDGVRHIGNFSTGKTGALISNYFIKQNNDVHVLRAENSVISNCIEEDLFKSASDLKSLLHNELVNNYYDAVIMMAAVSDFQIESIEVNGFTYNPPMNFKVDSSSKMSLHFKKSEKLLPNLIEFSKNKEILIFGFKLTKGQSTNKVNESIQRVLDNPGVKYCVHNDLSQITTERHSFSLYSKGQKINNGSTKLELAKSLLKTIEENI